MLKRLTLEAEQPLFFLSQMSQNGQFVQNVPKRAKCPDCPKTAWYYYDADFGTSKVSTL